MNNAAFISFTNGVCRRFYDRNNWYYEAIDACDTVNLEANILDENLNVIATVSRNQTAINGFVIIRKTN